MIFANINIKSLLKPIKVVLFASLLSVSISQNLSAKEIICGNTKCNIETRKCIKLPQKVCAEYSNYTTTYGVAVTQCLRYESYRCVGKNEEQYKANKEINVSTNDNGEVLTGENETIALRKAKTAAYTAGERMEIAEEHYSNVQSKDISKTAERILVKTEATEDSQESFLAENDTEDLRNAIKKLASYTTIKGYTEGKGSPGDTNIKDAMDDAISKLDELKEDGYITEDDYNRLKSEIGELYNVASQNLEAVTKKIGDEQASEKQRQERMAVRDEVLQKCATSAQLRARYNAGCWSCLVLERLTSAFLHAANKGLPVVQKAGITLLLLGSGLWIMFWALKSVSSFTQVQTANILNDLFKFLFKVCLAYVFITLSTTAISQYFIRPIMSVGAIIGQQFWDEKIKEYTFEWGGDEFISDDSPLVKKTAEDALKKAEEDRILASYAPEEEMPETQEYEEPTPIDPNASDEQIIIALQNAFLAVLKQQIHEIITSCTDAKRRGNCGAGCRFTSCSDAGHQKYVKDIFKWAWGSEQLNAYCQASVTAAMKKMLSKVAKNASALEKLHFYKGLASPPGAFPSGQPDVQICIGKQLNPEIKLNAGDTISVHHTSYQKVWGKVSGHHTITVVNPSGGGSFISFNGDTPEKSPLCASYSGLQGKIKNVSAEWRKILKENPNLKNELDLKQLAELGAGLNMSFINYEGGYYPTIDGSYTSGDYNYDSLVVDIPQEIKYTGPTNIMPKSIMNSILGAMRAITNTTADNMVLGNMVMCYAGLDNGGAWHVFGFKILNIFLWLEGAIIWALGFMLTLAVSYYFIDISFKIGFAVLAIPVVFGIWPFGFGQDKLFKAISIIAKSSATFAFLAITTAFGMDLVSEALNGLDDLYAKIDAFATETVAESQEDIFKAEIDNTLYLFSPTFIMMAFAIIYFYKMVQGTISDLVNKFFPDNVFGDSAPMHSAATMMTSFAHKMAMKVTGADLAKDIVAHQTGRLVKGSLTKAKDGVVGGLKAAAHPVRTGKQAYNAAKNLGKNTSSAFGKKK